MIVTSGEKDSVCSKEEVAMAKRKLVPCDYATISDNFTTPSRTTLYDREFEIAESDWVLRGLIHSRSFLFRLLCGYLNGRYMRKIPVPRVNVSMCRIPKAIPIDELRKQMIAEEEEYRNAREY
jgi:hypothetical protein